MGAEQKKSRAPHSSSQNFSKPTQTFPSFSEVKPSACQTSPTWGCLLSLPVSGWANPSVQNKSLADKKPQEPGKDRIPVSIPCPDMQREPRMPWHTIFPIPWEIFIFN